MLKINSVPFAFLTLAALYQFFAKLITIIERIGPDKLKIEALYNGLLLPAFQKLDAAYKKSQSSQLTKKLLQLDKLRDKITSAILGIINAMLKSTNSEEAAAAENLKFLFGKFKGINQKPRDVQSADTTNLLQELNGKFAADVELLGLKSRVAELKKVNEELHSYSDERVQETAEKGKTDATQAKKVIIDAYRTICKQIEVNMKMENSADYEDFVRNLNVIVGETGGSGAAQNNDDGEKGSQGATDKPLEENGEKYPNAREWSEDIDYQTCASGDIFYIIRNGVKEYYKLLDFGEVATFEPGMDDGGIWEKIEE